MMKERLIRILIIGVALALIIFVAKAVVGWRGQLVSSGKTVNLPSTSIQEKLEDLSGRILGKTSQVVPGASELEIIEQLDQEDQEEETGETQETQMEHETEPETEPIEEPVKNVQSQTELLIEMIKKLPADQFEAIKKQLYQEICEGVLKEE